MAMETDSDDSSYEPSVSDGESGESLSSFAPEDDLAELWDLEGNGFAGGVPSEDSTVKATTSNLQLPTTQSTATTMDNNDYTDDDPIINMDEQYGTLMDFLTDNPEMKKTAVHSLQQGLFAGGGAVAGGLVFGPLGGLIGGIAGSLAGFFQMPNYECMVQNIRHLPRHRQEHLVAQVRTALLAAGATAQNLGRNQEFRTTLVQLAAQAPVRDQIWRACVEALEHQSES